MSVLSKGDLFDPRLVAELIDNVKGKSSLARLSAQIPVPFNGQKEFVFTMGSEANLVAENGAKSAGSIGVAPVTIVPVKIEYGARVSDEFLYAAEEEQLSVLKSFNEGFAKKAARALDIMAIHGMNPRTASVSLLLGSNYFDNATQATYEGAVGSEIDANTLVETAIGLVGANDYDVTGIAMAPAFRTKLSKLTLGTQNQQPLFPELRWGAAPGTINGLPAEVNSTMAFGSSPDLALVGDFAGAFKWGYAKEVPFEVIQYGNPDNDADAGDLKGHNQVYLRCELYLGWGILDKNAFALIKGGTSGATGASGAST
jgi:HK97 family phage major capsid protein